MMEQEEVASWQIILLLVMEMLQLVREKQRKRTLNLLNCFGFFFFLVEFCERKLSLRQKGHQAYKIPQPSCAKFLAANQGGHKS